MPYEAQNMNVADANPYRTSGEINLLVFRVSWDVTPAGIEITTTIDFGLIQDTKTAVISFHNPSVEFSFGVFGFSAGLGIGFNDAKGDLELSAKACSPWGCEKSTTGINILPAYAFGLITQGVARPGIDFINAHFPHAGLQHDHLVEYSRLAGEVSREMGIEQQELADFMTNEQFLDLNRGLTANIETWNASSLGELKHVTGKDWVTVLATIVTDERVHEYFPGIDKKFDFPDTVKAQFAKRFETVKDTASVNVSLVAEDRDKVLEVIIAVCGSIVAIAGLSAAANAVLASVCLTILAIAAAMTGTAAMVVGVLALIGAVLMVVLTLVAVGGGILAAIAALIFGIWWIFSGNSVGSLEPYQGFRKFSAA